MQFFDTHAHIGLLYDDPARQFRAIQEAKMAGVTRIMSINNNLFDFKKEYAMLKTVKGIYHAVGVSPAEIMTPGKDWVNIIEDAITWPNVIAIGETGLDYFNDKVKNFKHEQIEMFIAHLELAQKHDVPVIIHNRAAGKDILEILKDRIPSRGAIFHCYSENASFAHDCLEAGLNVYFSFAGNLTYRNARNLHETVLNVPVDRILIETESPFMIPSIYRERKRTMPAYLSATANFLAEILDKDKDSLFAQLWKNSCTIFNLPE